GSSNAIHGIAMNVALQADHRSMFGYSLGCALGPHSVSSWSNFMRLYGCMVSLPGYYCEVIGIWNVSHPNAPFVECSGDTLTIQPYNEKLVPGLTTDKVAHHLIHHGIPPQWINHAYTFGLHYLNHQSYLWASPFHDLYYQMDCKCLQHLESVGVPVAILQWNSWWSPTYDDITHIQYLMSREDNGTGRLCFLDCEWLLAGAPAIFQELTGQTLWAPTTSSNSGAITNTSSLHKLPVVSTGM
ncbi:hypothetical protein L208DRAFT_1322059, partial [Tricholoma matsutake]